MKEGTWTSWGWDSGGAGLEGTAELSLAGHSWAPTPQSRGARVVCWGSASILQVEGAKRIGVWAVCGGDQHNDGGCGFDYVQDDHVMYHPE